MKTPDLEPTRQIIDILLKFQGDDSYRAENAIEDIKSLITQREQQAIEDHINKDKPQKRFFILDHWQIAKIKQQAVDDYKKKQELNEVKEIECKFIDITNKSSSWFINRVTEECLDGWELITIREQVSTPFTEIAVFKKIFLTQTNQ